MFRSSIYMLALCAFATSLQGQEHRTGAGSLDAEGWTDAVSTKGGFAVKLPCLYGDMTSNGQNAEGVNTVVNTLTCTRKDGAVFIASRVSYPKDEKVAEKSFKSMVATNRKSGATVKPLKHQGLKAVDLFSSAAATCAYTRVVRLRQDNLVLGIEAKGTKCETFRADADKLFASLAVSPS
jgi:hypothetical protein